MRKIVVLIFVLLLLTIPLTAVKQAEAVNPQEEIGVCAYAAYHPGFAYQCAMMLMFELWDPLDWGDGPSSMMGGGANSVSVFEGDGDDVTGSPGDSDDVTG